MKTFPIQLDDNLHKTLKHAAIDEGISLQRLIVSVLKYKVENKQAKNQLDPKIRFSQKRNNTKLK